jgi:hypothetical protein
MAFLEGLALKIIELIINKIWGDFAAYQKAREAQRAAQKEIEDRNRAAREKLERADTPEEREDAAGDIFRNRGNSPD